MPLLKNKRWENFSQYVVVDGLDHSAAYRKAYPKCNAKDKTVWNAAYKLSIRAEVKERMAEMREEIQKNTSLSKEMIVKNLEAVSQVSIIDYFDCIEKEDPETKEKDYDLKLIPKNRWTKPMMLACKKMRRNKDGTFDLQVHGIDYAYTELNKLAGYYADKTLKVETSGSLLDLIPKKK